MSETPPPGAAADLPRGVGDLADAFAVLGIDPPTVEHEAAFTVDQSRHLRGTIAGVHTKNLFLKDKKGALFLVTAPEHAEIDLKRIHTVIGAKGRVSFGSAEAMARVLGIAPGSVTPLALINDRAGEVQCVLDPRVASADLVNVHPLRNTATVTLTGEELNAFLHHTGHGPLVSALPAPEAD
ncbi:MAG: prolyl-tRNA synthetase associated domain-containing protein [Pseudomonadota bacterium]